MWTDGSAWDYEDWAPGQPNNNPGEDCLDLLVDDAQFHDIQCTVQVLSHMSARYDQT